jgi:hypothetical protein
MAQEGITAVVTPPPGEAPLAPERVQRGAPGPYRADVMEALARHGVRPRPETPPALVRDFLSDLYRWELRRLRDRLLAREFPRHEYARKVVEVRRRYLLLSRPIESWTEPEPGTGPGTDTGEARPPARR